MAVTEPLHNHLTLIKDGIKEEIKDGIKEEIKDEPIEFNSITFEEYQMNHYDDQHNVKEEPNEYFEIFELTEDPKAFPTVTIPNDVLESSIKSSTSASFTNLLNVKSGLNIKIVKSQNIFDISLKSIGNQNDLKDSKIDSDDSDDSVNFNEKLIKLEKLDEDSSDSIEIKLENIEDSLDCINEVIIGRKFNGKTAQKRSFEAVNQSSAKFRESESQIRIKLEPESTKVQRFDESINGIQRNNNFINGSKEIEASTSSGYQKSSISSPKFQESNFLSSQNQNFEILSSKTLKSNFASSKVQKSNFSPSKTQKSNFSSTKNQNFKISSSKIQKSSISSTKTNFSNISSSESKELLKFHEIKNEPEENFEITIPKSNLDLINLDHSYSKNPSFEHSNQTENEDEEEEDDEELSNDELSNEELSIEESEEEDLGSIQGYSKVNRMKSEDIRTKFRKTARSSTKIEEILDSDQESDIVDSDLDDIDQDLDDVDNDSHDVDQDLDEINHNLDESSQNSDESTQNVHKNQQKQSSKRNESKIKEENLSENITDDETVEIIESSSEEEKIKIPKICRKNYQNHSRTSNQLDLVKEYDKNGIKSQKNQKIQKNIKNIQNYSKIESSYIKNESNYSRYSNHLKTESNHPKSRKSSKNHRNFYKTQEEFDESQRNLSRNKQNFYQNQKNFLKNLQNDDKILSSLKCPECPMIFDNTLQRNRHARLHQAPKFECRNCLRRFKRKTSLRKHFCDLKCATCPKICTCRSTSSSNCRICLKIDFRYFEDYKQHMKTHGEIVICKICDKNKSTLFRHKQQGHVVIKHFLCVECGAILKSPELLKSHAEIHEKNFKCDKCEKIFTRRFLLQEHAKLHDDPKAFNCDICDKAFQRKFCLDNHMKVIHSDKDKEASYLKYQKSVFGNAGESKDWLRCSKCPTLFRNHEAVSRHMGQAHEKVRVGRE